MRECEGVYGGSSLSWAWAVNQQSTSQSQVAPLYPLGHRWTSDEVLHLQQDDELLVPTEFYPHPLANGNFLLMRANSKMIFAFKRSRFWRQKLRAKEYSLFDEWSNLDPPGTMMAVYQDMFLASELQVRPTRRMIIQDSVMMRGRTYPSISQWGAQVSSTLMIV